MILKYLNEVPLLCYNFVFIIKQVFFEYFEIYIDWLKLTLWKKIWNKDPLKEKSVIR